MGLFAQVDTAGWLDRTKKEKGPSTLSIVQSRKHLMRAHVVALVLDAEEVSLFLLLIFNFYKESYLSDNCILFAILPSCLCKLKPWL